MIDQETATTTNDEGAGGWEAPPQPLGTAQTPCAGRHRWQGGDVCIRCGTTKAEARQAPSKPRSEERTRSSGVRVGAFEALASALWVGLGMAIEYQPLVLNQNIKKLQNGKVVEVPDQPLKKPLARSIYMESALAGRRIDKAFHKASPFWYGVVAKALNKVSWSTEIAPLLIPPMVVGLAGTAPHVVERFKPMLVGALIPVLVEQAKVAQQQAEMMSQLEDVNKEILQQAIGIVDSMLNMEDDTTN